ncbi:hypothetical protein [Vreelandella alkaliphila]|uniref:DUF732 domain-containing protein n=1 Tax=Vreelandella alkaliphila TaxID=272774 RepID=A0AAJ2VVF4_9GAMM|nr:hypothetical protein [Halomonas alkaliphila]MDX5979570.1 hypothetical protein [Halomonas alkaliphila]
MLKSERNKLIGVFVGVMGFVGLAVAGHFDKSNQADVDAVHLRYCEGVAVWQAEAARAIPEFERTGHDDWRGIAEEYCPGLRPAP